MIRAYRKLPAERQEPYRALVNELAVRILEGGGREILEEVYCRELN